MTAAPLPTSTPTAHGIDPAGISRFLDAMETSAEVEPHSLMVLRHGYVVAAGWWRPYTPGRMHLLYSVSKSFTSTAAGLAVAEGRLRLDDPVLSYFPELRGEIDDARARSMLVRHLLAMASGHTFDTWERAVAGDPAEPVRGFLQLRPNREPGTVFAYNQSATYTLATIIQRVTGQTLSRYLRPRLFDPLGIDVVGWQQYPSGRDLGFSGLFATTDAVARLGQLYLQRGMWQGEQVLSPDWVEDATRTHIANAGQPNPDWQQGYGFQFWRSRHGYRGDGAHGQFCLVLPEQDMVVAITSATPNMQAVLDAVWAHLLPAAGAAPGAPGPADAQLHDRLAGLALPSRRESPAPPGDSAAWADAVFAPAASARAEPPVLGGVRVTETGDAWLLTLTGADDRLAVRLGTGDWEVTEPGAADDQVATAVSGGWVDADTLSFDVLFLETPHRLHVTCSRPGRTFSTRWDCPPLHARRLRDLGAPR